MTPPLPNPDFNIDDRTLVNDPLTFSVREREAFVVAGDADPAPKADQDRGHEHATWRSARSTDEVSYGCGPVAGDGGVGTAGATGTAASGVAIVGGAAGGTIADDGGCGTTSGGGPTPASRSIAMGSRRAWMTPLDTGTKR